MLVIYFYMRYHPDMANIFLPNHYTVKYISGIPDVTSPKSNYMLDIEKTGLKLNRGFIKKTFITWKDIKTVEIKTQGEITKGLSTGKAAVGWLLFGPLGALIGAGMKSTHDNRVFYVSVDYKDSDGDLNTLILESKYAPEIVAKVKKALKSFIN